jgi:hypothetical protein
VLADSQEIKCLKAYFSLIAGWCNAAIARVVFPIPPEPNIATDAALVTRVSIRHSSSDSRPRNMVGEAGSKVKESELERIMSAFKEEIYISCRYLALKELLPICAMY